MKKILGSGNNTTALIISNDEMKDVIEILRSLEDSGLLLKKVRETIQNEAREQKGGFISMFLDTLGANLFGNILAGKGVNGAGEGILRARYGNEKVRKTTTKDKMNFYATSSFN